MDCSVFQHMCSAVLCCAKKGRAFGRVPDCEENSVNFWRKLKDHSCGVFHYRRDGRAGQNPELWPADNENELKMRTVCVIKYAKRTRKQPAAIKKDLILTLRAWLHWELCDLYFHMTRLHSLWELSGLTLDRLNTSIDVLTIKGNSSIKLVCST